MAIKYLVEWESFTEQQWRIELDFPDYIGDPISLEADENPVTIEHTTGSDDNPFSSHVIHSHATFRIFDDNLDTFEIQTIQDGYARCRIYRDGELKHSGFLISDGVQDNDSGVGALVTLKSIDGLELLQGDDYVYSADYGAITVDVVVGHPKCPLNIIRKILGASEYANNPLPIRWMNGMRSAQYPNQDMLAGGNRLNPNNLFPVSYFDADKLNYTVTKSAYWWLENILKSAQCWLRQIDGIWYITNYRDIINSEGVFTGYEIGTGTGVVTATPVTVNFNRGDIAPLFEEQDAYWMAKKPLGSVKVIYENTTGASAPSGTSRNNVIPNGGFDLEGSELNRAALWETSLGGEVLQAFAINGEEIGRSAEVNNTTDQDLTIRPTSTIPLDSEVLFKEALLGFKWLPVSGYPTLPDDTIDYSKQPLYISVYFQVGVDLFYLNEFGYWSDKNAESNARILTQAFQTPSSYVITFESGRDFYPGDRVTISLSRTGGFTTYNIDFASTMDVQSGIDYIVSQIPGSNRVSTVGMAISQTNNNPSNTASTSKVDNYYRRIQIAEGATKLKMGDVLDIQFQSKGGASDIKIPSGMGKLGFEISVKSGCLARFDDVYFRTKDNNDFYELKIDGSKSPTEEHTLGISSSYSGHLVSSYMTDFGTANLARLWSSGAYPVGFTGKTLTQLYGEFVMDWRSKARRVFSGTIGGIVYAGDYVVIKGIGYVVLNSTVSSNDISNILAFEAGLETNEYTVKHTGTLEEAGRN